MQPHHIHRRKAGPFDPIFMSEPALPKASLPHGEMRPDDAFQLLHDELPLDGNTRQNMATFVLTWEEADIHKLMGLPVDKNVIDKDEHPQTAEIEARCIRMLAGLWHAPCVWGGSRTDLRRQFLPSGRTGHCTTLRLHLARPRRLLQGAVGEL
jgi:glutamate/tyrosine decarboxylase-like PLP-dependent enzyme